MRDMLLELKEKEGGESTAATMSFGLIELGPDEALELLAEVRGLSGEARKFLREIADSPRD